jgi:hypothetical protein
MDRDEPAGKAMFWMWIGFIAGAMAFAALILSVEWKP